MIDKTGLALLCNAEGVIIEILSNPPELEINLETGVLFSRLAAAGSLAKALSFLTEVRSKGTAFDHEINVAISKTHIKTFRFIGGTVNETMLVVGSEDGAIAHQMYEEMMRINNEQTNSLRNLLKEQSRSDSLYNELSYLNNELVAMQREIAKKNAELERLNEEKNHFLGMAAHDLRNPLHTILGFSDFLLEISSDPEQQKFLQIIRDVSQFMAHLVDDLLDVSKIEAGNLRLDYEPVNLASLIRRNVIINRPLAARKQIELIYQLDETLPTALVDSAKLEQVLNNLIGNAIKFSEPNNKVVVSLEQTAEKFLVSVADNGFGIAPEQKSRLFQPFQQGKRGTEGEKSTGLGLAIVKRIVKKHGGEIWFESELGQGTTFFIAIPVQPSDEENYAPYS
ncbi:MAG: HAMP domain-containing histidine kinase [Anaerolinea sp.]|nr:HAMP domain-containing histidine kinase [Anaerolinea sp.]